jgi:hypothetical protein
LTSAAGARGSPSARTDDILRRRESLELLRRYWLLPDGLRRHVHHLIQAMAGADEA